MQSEARGPSRRRFQVAIRQGGVRKRWEFSTAEEAEAARVEIQKQRDAGIDLVAPAVDQQISQPDPNLWLEPSRRWTPSERLYLELLSEARDA